MATHTACNICENPGTLENSLDTNQIYSNVNKFSNEKYTVWRCINCNSLHSKEDVDLDYYYKDYPNHTASTKRGKIANHAFGIKLKRLLSQGFKKENSLLDYGCGNGRMVAFLNETGYSKAIGYDKFNQKFKDDELLNKKFDFVISQDVIEHFENPVEGMELLANCLKPGGILSVTTAEAVCIDLENPGLYMAAIHQPYHRHIFSEKALKETGERIGLKYLNVYRRYNGDTLIPFCNERFVREYLMENGNIIGGERLNNPGRYFFSTLISNPRLIFYALFGYAFSPRITMNMIFQSA